MARPVPRPSSSEDTGNPEPQGIGRIWAAFAQRNFALYTGGNAVSLIGMWAQRIAVGWLAWELTGSGFWLGLVAFADLFPTIVVTPLAGVIADRSDRLMIIRATQILSLLFSLTLALLTLMGLMTVELLTLIVLANGLTMGFKAPSRMAITRTLVPAANLSTAIAINAIVFNLARFAGPAIAGLVIVFADVAWVFLFDAVTSALLVGAIHYIHLAPAKPKTANGRRPIVGDIMEGLRYAAAHPGIGPLILMQLVIGLGMRAFIELLPGFADQTMGRGADGLAMLSAAIGLGAMAAGVWLAQRSGAAGLTRIVIRAHIVAAVSLLGLALAPRFDLALVLAGLTGLALATGGVATQTLTQLVVDDDRLGRVMSLYSIIFRAAPALGALFMGIAADYWGMRLPFAIGALFCLVTVGWIVATRRDLARSLEPR
ncbi:MAG: MFS transporter [Geminicoccaceae bacterium]